MQDKFQLQKTLKELIESSEIEAPDTERPVQELPRKKLTKKRETAAAIASNENQTTENKKSDAFGELLVPVRFSLETVSPSSFIENEDFGKLLEEIESNFNAIKLANTNYTEKDYTKLNKVRGNSDLFVYEKLLNTHSKRFNQAIPKESFAQLEKKYGFKKAKIDNKLKESRECLETAKTKKTAIIETLTLIDRIFAFLKQVGEFTQGEQLNFKEETEIRSAMKGSLDKIKFNRSCYNRLANALKEFQATDSEVEKKFYDMLNRNDSKRASAMKREAQNTGQQEKPQKESKQNVSETLQNNMFPEFSTKKQNEIEETLKKMKESEDARKKQKNRKKKQKNEANVKSVESQEIHIANEMDFKELLGAIQGNFDAIKLANRRLSSNNFTDFKQVSDKSIVIYEGLLNEHSIRFSQIISEKNLAGLETKYNFKKEEIENKFASSRNLLEQAKSRERTIIETLSLIQRISTFREQAQKYTQGSSSQKPDIAEEGKIRQAIEGVLEKIEFNKPCYDQLTSAIEEFNGTPQDIEDKFSNMLNRRKEQVLVGVSDIEVAETEIGGELNYFDNSVKQRLKAKLKEKKETASSQTSGTELSNKSKEQKEKEAEEAEKALKEMEEKGKAEEARKKKKQAKKNKKNKEYKEKRKQLISIEDQNQNEEDQSKVQASNSQEKNTLGVVAAIDETRVVESQEKQNTHSEAAQDTLNDESSQQQTPEETSNALAIVPKKMSSRKKKALREQAEQLKKDVVEPVKFVEIEAAVVAAEFSEPETTPPKEKPAGNSTYQDLLNMLRPSSPSNSDQVQERVSVSESESPTFSVKKSEQIFVQDQNNNSAASEEKLNNNIEPSEEEEPALLTPVVTYYEAQIQNLISGAYDNVLIPIAEGFRFYARKNLPEASALPDPSISGVKYEFLIMKTQGGAYREFYAPVATGFQICTTSAFHSNFFLASPFPTREEPSPETELTQELKSLLSLNIK